MTNASQAATVIIYRTHKRIVNLYEFTPFMTLRNLMIRNHQLENKDI